VVPAGERAFAPGDAAMLMVRPERVRIESDEPAAPAVALPVTPTDLVFQGPVIRAVLRGPEGDDVVAHLESGRRQPSLARGAVLWASWDPHATRLLPPDAGASGEPAFTDGRSAAAPS
jgi:spermidine/putrescine transport system ATP-binding protein